MKDFGTTENYKEIAISTSAKKIDGFYLNFTKEISNVSSPKDKDFLLHVIIY